MKTKCFGWASGSAIPRERAPVLALVRPTAGLALLLALSACDFEVSNPGPVSDTALDDEQSFPAIVQGAVRQLTWTHNLVTVYGAYFAREGNNSGGSTEGHPYGAASRRLAGLNDPVFANEMWQGAHGARWLAEDGIRRMDQILGGEAPETESYLLAHLWAGFANRLLGENACYAVIDGGAPESHMVHFQRAEAQFTRAMELAATQGEPEVGTAALAARATVRAWQGKWPEAMADAAAVPRDFEWWIPTSVENSSLHNGFARANDPYSRFTVAGSYFESYFLETGDPRTPWAADPERRQGEDPGVLWLPERKYGPGEFNAPHRVGLGPEMQLLIAEGRLRDGDWNGALGIINERRAEVGVPLRTASSAEEAWSALKLERFIELWLEGRAMWDHRRYRAENTPGSLPATLDVTGRDLCYPISQTERDANPNIPDNHP